MESMTDQKIQEVHKWLDAFELVVLETNSPIDDMSFFQTDLASLLDDVATINAMLVVEPQVAL